MKRTAQTAFFCLLFSQLSSAADRDTVEWYAGCSAYFFMAANAREMGEFDAYYTAGEYAYNLAVGMVGDVVALEKFNASSTEISELIERNWQEFHRADERYGVVCADLKRSAHNPDPVAPEASR